MKLSCHWAQASQKRIALTVVLLTFLFCPWVAHAQTPNPDQTTWSRWSLQGAIGNQTIGFPFQNHLAAFNPALSDIGLEVRLNKHARHGLHIGIANTCLFNERVGNSYVFHLNLGYRYTHSSGVFGNLGMDIGSGILFYKQAGFTYNLESQRYESTAVRSGVGYSGFQLDLGYDLSVHSGKPLAFFIRNKFGFLSPYFPSASFPILPQNILEIGIIFKFKKLSSNPESL